jgi:hypothetical protein
MKGKAVPGLKEIIPAHSDYTHLVSCLSYRLVNHSNLCDASVTGKPSSYLKRMKHAIAQDDRFSGDELIGVLSFLRVFKEAVDHNELLEAAAARSITYFLLGIAKEAIVLTWMKPRRVFPAVHIWCNIYSKPTRLTMSSHGPIWRSLLQSRPRTNGLLRTVRPSKPLESSVHFIVQNPQDGLLCR